MNNRLRILRKGLNLTQEEFSKRIGIKRNTLANYEIGRNVPIDAVIFSICREFNINEEWLRTGQGDMFRELPEENEVAALVSDLLEENNPFFGIILDIMRTYNELDAKSQDVLIQISEKFRDIVAKKKES